MEIRRRWHVEDAQSGRRRQSAYAAHQLNWYGTDSPLNVATYEYVDSYWAGDADNEGVGNQIEIYAGNYIGCGKPQGAWVIGFRLFRDLVTHLDLNPPRKLKGDP